MFSFLDILRGPQSDFTPEREVRYLRPANERDARAGLKLADLAPANSDGVSAVPDPQILQAAIRVLKAQLRVAGENASKAKAITVSYERRIARLRSKVSDLKKEKAAAEKGQRQLRKALRAARREASRREADLKERLDLANTRVGELTADNYRLQSAKVQLTNEQTAVSARFRTLEGELATYKAENALLKGELQKQKEEVEAANSKLDDAMALISLEQEKTKSLESQVAQLRRQLADKDAFLTTEIQAHELFSDIYELQEQNATAQVEDEHNARTAAEQERDAMRAKRDQALADIESLKRVVDNQAAQIITLEEQYLAETLRSNALVVDQDHHLQQLQDLENALGDANAQYLDAVQVSRQLRKDLQNVQEAHNNSEILLKLANGTEEVSRARIMRLEKDIQELWSSKKALQDSISASSSPTLTGSDSDSESGSRALPLGLSLAFNFALQPEVVSQKPLRKVSNFGRFFTRQVDENVPASPQSPRLA